MYCLKCLHIFSRLKNRMIGINLCQMGLYPLFQLVNLLQICCLISLGKRARSLFIIIYITCNSRRQKVTGVKKQLQKLSSHSQSVRDLQNNDSCLTSNLHQFAVISLKKQLLMCTIREHQRFSSSIRPRTCKKFVVEDEEEITRTYYVDISLFEVQNEEVALCKILIHLAHKGLILQNKKFYMPKFKSIVEPYTFCRIKFDALNDPEIVLKSYSKSKDNNQIFIENDEFQKTQEIPKPQCLSCLTQCYTKFYMAEESCHFAPTTNNYEHHEPAPCPHNSSETNYTNPPEQSMEKEEQNQQSLKSATNLEQISEAGLQNEESINSLKKDSEQISDHSTHKRTREPQRGIGEVLYMVKVWRELHEIKKWSLIEAAKLIGISKKSLDDYYLVLRIGQIQGYDFAGNLTHKMGELRNFLRSKEHKVSGKLKHTFQSFHLIPDVNLDHLIDQYMKGDKFHID